MSGRRRGSWFQHRCINFHNRGVTTGCWGRDGRLPLDMSTIVVAPGRSLNGTDPVNTYVHMERW